MHLTKHRLNKFGQTRTLDACSKTGGKCAYCGIVLKENGTNKEDDDIMTLDHIIPLSKGGSKDISNLFASCRRCNNLKGNGTVDFLRMKIISMRKHWPKFNQIQYEFLVSRGVDISKFSYHQFYFEKQGLK